MTSPTNSVSILQRITLNPQQKEAVVCEKWPQLVFAGAGTGKTRVLTAKIAYLIEQRRVYPNRIFAATFTNKAAGEMRSRVENLVGISCKGMWIGTFHSMCARILRQQAHRIGYTPAFTIFDQDDQLSLLRAVMKSLELDERTMQPRHALSVISKYKNRCLSPEDVAGTGKSYYDQEAIRVYEHYQKALVQQQAMDFDDLIANAVRLLRAEPEVLQNYRTMFEYVLVDEYQDTNVAQFHLVQLLASGHGRVFVVGDDDQSIYGWRGAQVENILSFDRHFPNTTTFKLEENYRSTQAVLDFANAVIRSNTRRAPKQLWTGKAGGAGVIVARYGDDRQEAQGVVERVSELSRAGTKLGDMAVLFRTNAQSRAFEEALRRRNVPYVLVGGISFYERKEIKDCLAYLRLLVNPKDDVSCDRILNVPSRGIGAKSRDTLIEAARRSSRSMLEVIVAGDCTGLGAKSFSGLEELRSVFLLMRELVEQSRAPNEILQEMLTVTGYIDRLESEESEEADARLENINELMNALAIWSQENEAGGIAEFLEEVSLATDIDRWDKETDSLNLMTLHCAKGLEFSSVFVVGLEDGLLPSRQNFDDEAKLAEECRLFYVGATRAMRTLECSHVDQRWRFGSLMPMTPSRFLEAVPEKLFDTVDHTRVAAEALPSMLSFRPQRVRESKSGGGERRKIRIEPQHDEFDQDIVQYRMGQHVMHRTYGPGKILSISGFGPDMRLTILFNDGTRKRLMARFANLESS